ncbi:MAG: TonB-dependent receptor [Gammaproteobacteria bacterium]|nr:TonB-dependent receptor [Gammaproteobacteria bacterium]MYD02065.1 TonB-dependent receptor [Gammaproteobacteria bacterium]MYI24004.1 TonB-dependent receptor [Gammaproteobacteria bacterium]
MRPICRSIGTLTLAIGIGVLVAMPAHAQVDTAFEEIVVTTRKKEENLQDIPIAVNALSREDMERAGVRELNEIAHHDSSLQFDRGFSAADTRLVIRGLAPTRGRPNAATLIDGIDISSETIGVAGGTNLINPRLLDIERVEVVKGPQSALYGRSAFAGAVQYVTRDPSDETEGEFGLDGAEEGYYTFKGSLSGPLGERAGYRLNALYWEEGGFHKNSITGNGIGGGEGLGIAATLKFEPNDSSSYKMRVEYADDEFEVAPQANIPFNGINRVPAAASRCNGGYVHDDDCDGPAKIIQDHLLRTQASDPDDPAVFDDMDHPGVIGELPDGDELEVRLTPDYRRGIGNDDFPGSTREVLRFSLVADWSVGPGTLSSLTGVADADSTDQMDLDKIAEAGPDGMDISIASQHSNISTNTSLLSQELRYVSELEGRFNFALGAQLWQEDVEQNERNNTLITGGTYCSLLRLKPVPFLPAFTIDTFGAVPQFGIPANPMRNTCKYSSYPAALITQQVYDQTMITTVLRDTDHRSAYLSFDFNVTETLLFHAEARWTDETTDVTAPNTFNPAARRAEGTGSLQACGSSGNCIPGVSWGPYPPNGFGTPGNFATPLSFSRSDSYVTPKVSLQWDQSDDAMWYFSWAAAKKPGGFSTLGFGGFGADANGNGEPDEIEFEPEEMQVWELGMKRTMLDGRLRFNGAYFFQDFTDKQISIQRVIRGQLGTVISNASGAEVHGVELDASWLITDNWSISGGYTWLNGEYTDYKVITTSSADPARIGNCNLVEAGGRMVCEVDRTGFDLERTPDHAWQFTLAYQGPSRIRQGWDTFASFSALYQSERFIEDYNKKILKAYWRANLNFGLATDEWEFAVYVKNVFDDDTITWAGGGPGMPVSDWRFALLVDTTRPGPPAILPAPRIASTVYGYLPDPRQIGVRLNWRF